MKHDVASIRADPEHRHQIPGDGFANVAQADQ